VAEEQVAASVVEPVVGEHGGGESAYAAEQSSEQHAVENACLPQQANETDGGYGAVPAENVIGGWNGGRSR